MCDIKTEPEGPACRGCLCRERELKPLIFYDLYWSLLNEDQKIEALGIPQITMCWECTAMVQKIQKFKLQVQEAHTILRDSLEQLSSKETLSSLGVQHKRNYDAIFTSKLPTINDVQCALQFEEDTEVNDELNNKSISREQIHSEDECKIEKSSYNDDDHIETDNACWNDQEHPEQNELGKGLKKTALRSSQTLKKTTHKRKPSVDAVTQPIQFVTPETDILLSKLNTNVKIDKVKGKTKPVPLIKSPSIVKLEAQLKSLIKMQNEDNINRCKSKSKKNTSNKKDNQDIDTVQSGFSSDDDNLQDEGTDFDPFQDKVEKVKGKTKPVPLIKSPLIAKLETQLKNFIKMQNEDNMNRCKSKSKKNTINKNDNQEIDPVQSGFSSDDDNLKDEGTDFDPFQDEVVAVARLNKDEKAKRAKLVKNPELLKLEGELKKIIADPKAVKRKINDRPESDPDFNPEEDKTSDVDDDEGEQKEKKTKVVDESKHNSERPRKYRKVIVRYNSIGSVLQYFTETEMNELEYRSVLEKEDAFVNDKRPQICFECGRCFPHRKALFRHARNIHRIHDTKLTQVKTPTYKIPKPPEKPRLWHCTICQRMLRKDHTLSHFNDYHRLQWLCNGEGCEWSPKIFWNREDLMEHWSDIHKEFHCDYCGRRYLQKSNLDWHIQENHIQTCSIQCPQCPQVFKARKFLQNHIRYKHAAPGPEELRYCVECDITFPNELRYKLHLNAKHKPKKKWPCGECDRVLYNRESLESHYAIHHGGITRYQCEFCGKYMSRKARLEVHVLKHKNIVVKVPNNKPCSVCGRKFQSNRVLRHHMYTHTGERPYACTLCEAAYTQPYCLKVHLFKAHGIQKSVPERQTSCE